MFDSKNRDLLFQLPRKNRKQFVCIFPDIAFASLFIPTLFSPSSNVDVILLSDMIPLNTLKALLPNPSNIHKVQCFSSRTGRKEVPVNQEIQLLNCNPSFISIDLRLLKLSATIAEKMNVKRASLSVQGNKRICFSDEVPSIGGDMVQRKEGLLERVMEGCIQVGSLFMCNM